MGQLAEGVLPLLVQLLVNQEKMRIHFIKAIETEHLEWKLVFRDVEGNAKLEITFLLKVIYVKQRGD